MPVILTAQSESFRLYRCIQWCTCWKVELINGSILRFTDHDKIIELFDGENYTPAGGYSESAQRKEAGIKADNLDVVGLIDDVTISTDDIRAGFYDNAQVTHYIINWMYPWASPIITDVAWIANIDYNRSRWECELLGISNWLRKDVGGKHNKRCRYQFCESATRCTLDKPTYTSAGLIITSIEHDRRQFSAGAFDPGNAFEDDYFKYGEFEWKTGNNAGIKGWIESYDATNKKFTLRLFTPFDIEIGDTFDVVAGCDGDWLTCVGKFDNGINHGGYWKIPGKEDALKTPDSA